MSEPYFIKAWIFKADHIAPAFGIFPSKAAAKALQRVTGCLQMGYEIVPVYLSEEKPVKKGKS